MKYGVISDIHSNIQAESAALEILEKEVEKIICLGDIVGYNANPVECIELTRSHKKIAHIIQGNHDDMAIRSGNISFGWSTDAYNGLIFSRSKLNDEHRDWIHNLPMIKKIHCKNFSFVITHGSPDNSYDVWEYVLNNYEAQKAVKAIRTVHKVNIGFFGHTHVATFCEFDPKKNKWEFYFGSGAIDVTYSIDPAKYYVINPGAIGQPRINKTVSFAIFDTRKCQVEIRSFDYDWKSAMDAVYKAGYSNKIAERLDKSGIEDLLRPEYR